jgi:hypothetical protein
MVTVLFAYDCVSVCVSPFHLLNQLTNFHEIWYELYVIGGHLKSTLYIFLQSVVTTWPVADRVRVQFRSFGIIRGQSDSRVSFLRVLPFPLRILILSTAPHSLSIIQGSYNRPISGRRTK